MTSLINGILVLYISGKTCERREIDREEKMEWEVENE
jgi:hypothetical protein